MSKKLNKTGIQALTDNDIDLLIIQVNCSKTIDSLILEEIVNPYPEVKENYLHFSDQDVVFGNTVLTDIDNNKTICLAFTSYYDGKPKNKYLPNFREVDSFKTRLNALKTCLKRINKTHNHLRIGIDVRDIENKKLESASNLTNEEYYDIMLLHHIEKIGIPNLTILT